MKVRLVLTAAVVWAIMKPASRVASALVPVGLLVALLALPAVAVEGDESSGAPTGQMEPAVPTTAPPETEAQLDWTYRYMIPTAIGLGVVVIVLTSAQYFTRVVRKRYRIVDE